jgi:hypothetical protein
VLLVDSLGGDGEQVDATRVLAAAPLPAVAPQEDDTVAA